MSRKPIIAGNWKMNKTLAEAQAFAEAVKGKAPSADLVDTVIGSPALFLAPLAYNLKDDVIQLAAQNSYFENAGAFTGENSPAAIADLGIEYIIIEHYDAVTNIQLTNQDTPMEKASAQILASYLDADTKWGLFNGFSSRPMMPIAVKMLFSKSRLKEDSELIKVLKVSKDDIRLLRHYNMFTTELSFQLENF